MRILVAEDSAIYLDLLPLVNAQAVRLLEHDLLRRELLSLERRRGAAGKDRIDHPRSGHDDIANAVAGVLTLVAKRTQKIQHREVIWG